MKKLEVIVKTRTTPNNNFKFKTYAVKTKLLKEEGKAVWYDLRFTKEVPADKLPKCHSYIYVPDDKMNLDRSNKYIKVWVHAVDTIEEIERPVEDLSQYFD